jgi:hypothetical protein
VRKRFLVWRPTPRISEDDSVPVICRLLSRICWQPAFFGLFDQLVLAAAPLTLAAASTSHGMLDVNNDAAFELGRAGAPRYSPPASSTSTAASAMCSASTGVSTNGITLSGNAKLTFWNDVTNDVQSLHGLDGNLFRHVWRGRDRRRRAVNFEADVHPGFSPRRRKVRRSASIARNDSGGVPIGSEKQKCPRSQCAGSGGTCIAITSKSCKTAKPQLLE